RATLEEVAEADLILHVRDIASLDSAAQARDVEAVLARIPEAEGKPRRILEVWNKVDLIPEDDRGLTRARALRSDGRAVAVSATTGEGLDTLRERIADLIDDEPEVSLVLGPEEGEALAWLYQNGR